MTPKHICKLSLLFCLFTTIIHAQKKLEQIQNHIHTVYFQRNSAEIETLTSPIFNTYLEKLSTLSIDSISVNGYSDYLGNREYNLRLSEKRAQNVFNALKKIEHQLLNRHLINTTKVTGFGEVPALFFSPQGIPEDRKVNIVFHITPEKHIVNEEPKRTYFKAENGMKFNKSYILGKVFFVGNKPDVIEASFPELENLYKQIKQLDSDFKLVINGHICCLETNATEDDKTFSRVLSTARALRIKEFLVEKGIDSKHIDYKGYSFDEPLVYPELTDEDKQKNRRIEVVIYK